MKYIYLFIMCIIIIPTTCYNSSNNYFIAPKYNEECVQLILQSYQHYSLQSFTQIVTQASHFVPIQTDINNQEALRRRIAETPTLGELATLCNSLSVHDQKYTKSSKNSEK